MHRVLIVLTVVLLTASCQGGSDAASESLAEGDEAPSFRLPSAEGGTVALSHFSGTKPVLLYFSMGPG
jgi:hypothetical protein